MNYFRLKKNASKAKTSMHPQSLRIKLEINRKNILELRTESDSIKMQTHKASVQI